MNIDRLYELLFRAVLRWRGQPSGNVRALQEWSALQGVLRFSALFATTILVPALMLAYFALSSIRAEEMYVDADIERRTDSTAQRVVRTLEEEFNRFEQMTRARLTANQSVLSQLDDLSPHLRVAFRFDALGRLADPFAAPTEPAPKPSPAWNLAMREGYRLERARDFRSAAAGFARAAAIATTPAAMGTAHVARGRVLLSSGAHADADRIFADVYADYAATRDDHGFRIGDLAQLNRAESAFRRDPEVGTIALQDVVDRLLATRWVIGQPGEAAVARRALTLVTDRAEPEWVTRSKNRLEERTLQMFWAERLAVELDLLGGLRPGSKALPDAQFQYVERSESRVLWSIVAWGDSAYAFAFDHDALLESLRTAAREATRNENLVRATVASPRTPVSENVRTVRSLGPWMPSLNVVVSPADTTTLAATKARKRISRVAIVLLAVGMSALGVVLAVRLVRRELETAKIKADFAANVSHELRSPITQIRLKGEALQLGLVYDDTDRQQHYDAIVHESERLSRLVDNVLDFSSIESGAKRYTFRPEDLAEVLRNAVESVRDAVESRGLEIEVDVPDDLPVIWLDREAIAQVVTNLLSNAAKYGAEGGWVGVAARIADDRIEIDVSDRGAGIRAEEQERIFDRFYRSGDPNIRRHRGTGIGLTIVQYIIEEHGGKIRVHSQPGRGTTFSFDLPLQPREPGA